MNNDLISREDLKEALANEIKTNDMGLWLKILTVIDNVPTVESEPKDAWISVSESLPDKEGKCLVFTDYDDVTMDSYRGGLFVCNLGNVTHWQPLPKAPESEGK